MAPRPIQALIIRPDNTYEIREIDQDIRTTQGLVGGYLEAVTTPRATLWCNEHGKIDNMPVNMMATYLWWKLQPEAEGRDELRGCVFVTGQADEDGDMLPIKQGVLDLYGQLEGVRRDVAAGRN